MKSLALNLLTHNLLQLIWILFVVVLVNVVAAGDETTSKSTLVVASTLTTYTTTTPAASSSSSSSSSSTEQSSLNNDNQQLISSNQRRHYIRQRQPQHQYTTTSIPPSLQAPQLQLRRHTLPATTTTTTTAPTAIRARASLPAVSRTATTPKQFVAAGTKEQQQQHTGNRQRLAFARQIQQQTRHAAIASTTTAAPVPKLTATIASRRARTTTTTTANTAETTEATTTTTTTATSRRIMTKPTIISETTTLASTRLVRDVDETIASTGSSIMPTSITTDSPANSNKNDYTNNNNDKRSRQNRSFQTNGNQPYEDTETKRKFTTFVERRQKQQQQQQQQQPQYYIKSYRPSSTASPTTSTATTATTPKPQVNLKYRTNNTSSISATDNLYNQQQQQQQQQEQQLANDQHEQKPSSSSSSFLPSSSSSMGNIPTAKTKLTSLNNLQTPKTPRMIHRLVAGHLQNSNVQISNSADSNSTEPIVKISSQYGVRRPDMISSTYRDDKLNANIRIASPVLRTTDAASSNASSLKPPFISRIKIKENGEEDNDEDYHDDDEALLDDSNDFDSNWDNGILRLSAGSGKENINPKKAKDDGGKKTLADQVRDGKYGLIEKELFRRTPKRPGILSYLPNKEVPEDNAHNFGGLNEEDIWLAEDHLLVIKGGSLNDDNPDEPWPAIDDYAAPKRQIKISSNPKVPPPFPVQLEENGPIQLIGNNKLTVVYPVSNQSLPVYTFAGETNNPSSDSDSDDEKNLITRPGAPKDVKENNQPPYNYPAPSPPWLYHNQTFVNPSLNGGGGGAAAKPLGFPILGPFLYGKNGSLDNFNGTEDFDEDDPSLYYPPAYSFTYKSNYTNPVPPGPLVPGIVVPPPPDHFSKLEKFEKAERRPHYSSTTTISPPVRHRVQYSTTPSTTSTSTTTTTTTAATTTTTAASAFGQVITRISEYTPKVINIVTPAPRPIYSQTPSPPIYSRLPPATPQPALSAAIEPVGVPVAVPIPIYSVNLRPTAQPNIVSFVPTSPEPHVDSFSKSNPIYYEYFEAKRQKGASNVIDDFLATTAKPQPSPKPIKLYATSKRPYKNQNQGHHRQNYLQPLAHNHRYADENIVVITPKPEVRFKPLPVYKQRPLHNFDEEVNAIRQTIRYYQNQELRDNNIPRTPKAKPVYNYNNYESSKTAEQPDTRNQFHAPAEFDVEPFKPMVTYSPSVNDENGFRALAVEKVDAVEPKGREELEISLPESQPNYPTSTTLIPVQPPHGRIKKLRIGAKYLQQPAAAANQEFNRQNAWVAVGSNDNEQNPISRHRERYQEPYQLPAPAIQQNSRNRDFQGYYYGSGGRQNHRFYEEPFQNSPNRKIVNYRPQQQQQQQQQQQHQSPIQWSLENDTYVNYAANRPPLNPDAEFINPYQTIPLNPYQQQQQQQQQRLTYQPPALSHQSQYYAPPAPPQPPQRLPGRQYQQVQPPVSLHRDILVNYRQPLPAINPDSEYISHPNVLRSQQQQPNQLYRTNYRLPPQPLPPLGAAVGESDVYYLTPKYRRANNLNPNNNNNNPNNNNNNQFNNNNNSGGK